MDKYRIYNIETGLTVEIIKAKSIEHASFYVYKWYGDREDLDVEEWENPLMG